MLTHCKTLASVFVCLILAVARAFAEDGSAEETIFTSAASPQLNIIYTVSRAAMLQPMNLWDPLNAPCPADLQLSVNKAKEHLLKTHNIKTISLISIQLVHKSVFLQEGEIPSNTPQVCKFVVYDIPLSRQSPY